MNHSPTDPAWPDTAELATTEAAPVLTLPDRHA
ncbi:hypothetical protein B1M_43785, partial [Burkholderia sp. TJI49]